MRDQWAETISRLTRVLCVHLFPIWACKLIPKQHPIGLVVSRAWAREGMGTRTETGPIVRLKRTEPHRERLLATQMATDLFAQLICAVWAQPSHGFAVLGRVFLFALFPSLLPSYQRCAPSVAVNDCQAS